MRNRTTITYRLTVTEVRESPDGTAKDRTVYEATTPKRPSLIALAELVEGVQR